MKQNVSHIKHEPPVIELDHTNGPVKRKSPCKDTPGPSNSMDHGPEAKRQKQATTVRHPIIKYLHILSKPIIIFVLLSLKKDERVPATTGEGKVKSEYYSDNSASLPGIMGTPGPVGFEPGMFKKEVDEHKQKSDSVNKVNDVIEIYS